MRVIVRSSEVRSMLQSIHVSNEKKKMRIKLYTQC